MAPKKKKSSSPNLKMPPKARSRLTLSYPGSNSRAGDPQPPVREHLLHGFGPTTAKKDPYQLAKKPEEDSWDTPPQEEKSKRPTNPATPISLLKARSDPSIPRHSQIQGLSIPCGPINRISMGLQERGVSVEHANQFFALIHAICPEEETRPLEADEREIWLGSTRIGAVHMHKDTPILRVPLKGLIHANAPKGTKKSQKSISTNSRTLNELMRYFGKAWGKVVAAIQFDKDVAIVARPEGIFLDSSEASFQMQH